MGMVSRVWMMVGGILAAFPAVQGADAPSASSGPSPANVVVVANSREPDSETIAHYYMQKRGIPDKNLIMLDAPTDYDVSWSVFVEKVFNPLRVRLVADGWLSAYTTDLKDSEGRLRFVFYGNKIDFLVMCYGLPMRIINDPARLKPTALTEQHKELNTNQAAVDSELSLLAALDTPIVGMVNNPLFNKLNPDPLTRSLVVKVARLDGPGIAAVKGMIDSALTGETQGVQGRAYIDMGGPHEEGENWLRGASAALHRLGFDTSEDHDPALMGWAQRFDAPAFYFGWYAGVPGGAIADPQLHFPPGAVAVHIYSFSADQIRNPVAHWAAPLIAHGVAATVGNVFEPYLTFTHHLDLFMEAIAAGKTVGEASYYALPALSWMEVFIGDPLYRPLAAGLPGQLDQAVNSPGPYATYAVIRQMNLLQNQGHPADALVIGEKQFDQHPDLPLAYALAQLEHALDHDEHARQLLVWATGVQTVPHEDLGLLCEMARWAVEHGAPQTALELYAKALAAPGAAPEFTKAALTEAIALAKQTGADAARTIWEKQLSDLH